MCFTCEIVSEKIDLLIAQGICTGYIREEGVPETWPQNGALEHHITENDGF